MKRVDCKKAFSVVAIVALMALGVVLPIRYAFGLSDEKLDYFADNGIMFYDPGDDGESSATNPCSVAGDAQVSGTTAKQKVWSGLKSLGVTDEVAAGIMGNMRGESGFGPTRYESSHYSEWTTFDWENDPARAHGVGLIQWSGGRRVKLFKYFREKNSALTDKYLKQPMSWGKMNGDTFIASNSNVSDVNQMFSLEVSYLIQEMKNSSYYSKVFNETTVKGAAVRFSVNVEGCARCVDTSSQSVKNRIKFSEEIYDEFHGKTSFEGGTASAEGEESEETEEQDSGACYNGDETSLQNLVLSWAWPEVKHTPASQRKPEYIEGLKNSIIAWRGGGGCGGEVCETTGGCTGVDCGGFVHSLVRVSGWDTTYPGGIVDKQQTGLHDRTDWEDVWESIKSNSDFKVGDVIICSEKNPYKRPECNQGHVVIYVGKIDGFASEIASASWCGRAPSADQFDGMHYIKKGYSVYRKVK